MIIREYDIVSLINDLPEFSLKKGDIGAVIMAFDDPTVAYGVEFCDEKGVTRDILTLNENQIEVCLDEKNLYFYLFQLLSHIKDIFDTETEYFFSDGKVLGHILFGDEVNPYIIDLLGKEIDLNKINDIFNFIELMARSKDKYVLEILVTTILERLGDDKEILNKAYRFMGERTRELSCEIDRFLGRL